MLSKDAKLAIIAKHQTKDGDTGSPQVQVALLTEQITVLTEHLKKHRKDDHSRRGLIGMVQQRRKLLNYLKKKDFETYQSLIETLGLKR